MKRNAITLVALVALGFVWFEAPAHPTHDQTPPETSISAGPGARTTDTTPTFRFAANESPVNFVCKRDGKRFKPCSSPKTLSPLPRGRHGFYVKSIDPYGNIDATAAAYTFKVVRP